MTTATVDLYEDVRLSSDVEVDAPAGILRNVPVLGLKSANGRRYLPEAVREARGKYEGRDSYTDHAKGDRSVHDKFGWFDNIREGASGGLRGDFHVFNPQEPLAVRLFNAAKNKPDAFGFSHHAKGRVRRVDGEDIVEAIEEVYSVDLVDKPATTKGLHEGREPMKLKAYYRALADRLTEQRHAPLKGRLVKLLEDDMGMMPDATMPDAAAPSDPDEALKAGFKAAIHAVVDDDSLDMAGKLAKIKEILKAQEKLMGAKDEPADGAGDATPDEGARPPAGNLTEARQLRAELEVRDLLEEAGVKFARPEARRAFVKALVPLSAEDRQALIEERKTPPRPANPPRSGPATRLTESQQKWPDPNDLEAVAKRVRG